MYPKLHLKVKSKVNFEGQFTPGKPKILVKTQISPKTKSLGLSNSKYQVPEKSLNPGKINLKKYFRSL